ncbi:uncharacterized protein LOC131248116 isoform X2 [Magnolia sinica]|uniref:uncharacterized protein LOC131248116 isoform X2 n=1 Tax=Magnolia sinica TaxID=86752 RepID=UPI0026596998|nr:uncharacterized protein LOC131248116 isoform X2 [Magnolia sinica]
MGFPHFPSKSSSQNTRNAANELVDVINENRTAHKLPKLHDSPGLGCMALQYVRECTGNCTSNHTVSCRPPEEDITEVYAPNCGVELPTVNIISGRIIGCQSKYLTPAQAFSDVLARDKKTLSLVHNKGDTEVGVGIIRGTHRGPFFWCVLFSNGQTNSTFVLEGGKGIKQKKGCFSGMDVQCSDGQKLLLSHGFLTWVFAIVICFISGTIIYS